MLAPKAMDAAGCSPTAFRAAASGGIAVEPNRGRTRRRPQSREIAVYSAASGAPDHALPRITDGQHFLVMIVWRVPIPEFAGAGRTEAMVETRSSDGAVSRESCSGQAAHRTFFGVGRSETGIGPLALVYVSDGLSIDFDDWREAIPRPIHMQIETLVLLKHIK